MCIYGDVYKSTMLLNDGTKNLILSNESVFIHLTSWFLYADEKTGKCPSKGKT